MSNLRLGGGAKGFGRGFLADLTRAWLKHGRETLERLSKENPSAYLAVMVRLTNIQQCQLGDCPGFDERRYRADVVERLRQGVAARDQASI
jgi:hypothetical protein